MAKIGFEYVCAAELTENESTGEFSYKDGKYLGPSAGITLNTNNNDVKDYGDDRTVASDTTLNNITLSLEINEFSTKLNAWLLGHAYNEEKRSMKTNTEDVAPNMGVGFIGKSLNTENKLVYRSVLLYKCKFAEPSDENTTKGESTTFNHTTIEGTATPLANHDIKDQAEFDTLEEAKEWINDQLGIVA